MTRAEQDVRTAARLYECRDAARFIFGDRYVATIEPWRGVLAEQMTRGQQSVLQAALFLGKRTPPDAATTVMLIFAAALEMIEQPAARDAVGSRPTAHRTGPRA